MPKQLNVNLAFTADTSKASQQLSALQKQLSQLTSGINSNSGTKMMTKDIADATAAAAKLQQQLQAATNVDTGKLDLSRFAQSLDQSGMSLQKYQEQLSNLGPAGDEAFGQLARAIANAEMPIRRSSNLLNEFKTTLMNTARWQISSSILHGFIGSIQSAVGYARDLNESLNNIRIVTGQGVDQMAAFADNANKAAKALSTSTLDYTNASLIYYQQGLSDKEVAERTETTLKLANVSRQSAEQVSNQMTAIWNNFDDGTKSLEYYADAITALGAKTASSSAEIAQGLSKFAAVADTIGLSYETATAALATVVAETRQSADTVGTAFKALFSRIESLKLGETLEDGVGLTKYTQALQTVGVQVLDINGNLKDADTILEELGQRWNQISRSQQVALAQTVAGQRQYTQMVALMENWDKVTANREIAAGSEGTLQSQQDIYAESWEAASKRVQASLQSIYQDLLDDKFFIGFLNSIEKILTGIDTFIDKIGGLKGVITGLGAILTQVFAKDLANTFNNLRSNIDYMTGKSAERANKIKEQASEAMAGYGTDASTYAGKAMGIVYSKQGEIQQQLINNQKRMTDEQVVFIQKLMDSNNKLGEEAIAINKAATAQQDKVNKIQDELNAVLKLNNAKNSAFDLNRYKEINVAIGEARQQVQNLSNVFKETDNFKIPLKIDAEALEQEKIRIQQTINNLKGEESLAGNEQEKQAINDTVLALEALLEKYKEIEQYKQNGYIIIDPSKGQAERDAINNMAAATQNAKGAINDLSAVEKQTVAGTQEATREIRDLATESQNLGSTAESGAQSLDNYSSRMKLVAERSQEAGRKTIDFGQKIALGAQLITATYNAADRLSSIMDNFNPEDPLKSFEEGLASCVTLVPTLATLVVRFGEIMAGGMPAAAGLILGVTVAFAGLKWIIGKVREEQAKVFDQTANERWHRMEEASQREKDKLQELQQEAEHIKDTFDQYDSVIETLNKCTKGTADWRAALSDVNTAVSEIIREYPELLSMVNEKGERAITRNKDGALEIQDWAREELLRENEQRQIQAESAVYFTSRKAREAEIETKTQEYSDSTSSFKSDLAKDITEGITDAYTNFILSDKRVEKVENDERTTGVGIFKSTELESFYKPKQEFNLSRFGHVEGNAATGWQDSFGSKDSFTSSKLGDSDAKDSYEGQEKQVYSLINSAIKEGIEDNQNEIAKLVLDYNKAVSEQKDTTEIVSSLRNLLTYVTDNYLRLNDQNSEGKFQRVNAEEIIGEFLSDSQLEKYLGNKDVLEKASEITGLEQANQTAIANENDIIARSIISNNSSLLNSENLDDLILRAGDVYGAMYSDQLEALTDSIVEASGKDDHEDKVRDSLTEVQEYIKSNDELAKTAKVDYDASEHVFEFLNAQGEKLGEATAEEIAAYQVATQTVGEFTDTLISNSERISKLRKSESREDALAGDYAATGNFNSSSYKNLYSRMPVQQTDGSTTGEAFSQKSGFNKILGIDADKEAELLGKTFEQALADGDFDIYAKQIGKESAEELYNGLLEELEASKKRVKSAYDELLGELNDEDTEWSPGKQLKKDLKDLSAEELLELTDITKSLELGPAGKQAGEQFAQGLELALSQATNSKEKQKIFDAIFQIDWTQGSQAISILTQTLKEQGIELDTSSSKWNSFANNLDNAGVKIQDLSSVTANFGGALSVLSNNMTAGSTIKLEDYETLLSVFPELDQYFISIDEDTKRLTTDLNDVDFSSLENVIAELNSTNDLFLKIKETGALSGETLLEQFSDEDIGTKGSFLNDIALNLGYSQERIEQILEDGGQELEYLKENIARWYQTGIEGGYESNFVGEMLASLTKDAEKLRKMAEEGIISPKTLGKQQDYINSQKISSGEELTQDDIINSLLAQSGAEDINKATESAQEILKSMGDIDITTPEGLKDLYDNILTLNGELKITPEGWTNFVNSVSGTKINVPDLDKFKNNFSELATFLGTGGVDIGSTISTTGFEALTTLMPDVKDSFIQINDSTWQLAESNEALNTGLVDIVNQFKNYEAAMDTVANTLKETNVSDFQEFINDLEYDEGGELTNDSKLTLLTEIQSVLGDLTESGQLETFAKAIGYDTEALKAFTDPNWSGEGADLLTLASYMEAFIEAAGGEGFDASQLYNMVAASIDLKHIDEEIAKAHEAGNIELEEALNKRKQILEETEKQKQAQEELNNLLNAAGDKDNHYDDERKDLYLQAKSKAEEQHTAGTLSDEDYTSTLQTIGKGIAEIDSATVHTREDMLLAKQSIHDAFADENGNISDENIKAYNDAIIGLITNADEMSLEEKFEEVDNFLTEQGLTDIKYYKEELFEILMAESYNSQSAIDNLNLLLATGKVTAEQYLELLKLIMDSNPGSETPQEQMDALNANKDNITATGEQAYMESQGATDKSQLSESGLENMEAAGQQAYVDQAQNIVNNLDQSSFEGIDDYIKFFDSLPEGVEYTDKLKQSFEGIKGSVENLEDLDKLQGFLEQQGQSDLANDEDLFNQTFDKDVKNLGFDPEEVRDYADVVKDDLITNLQELAESEDELSDEAQELLKDEKQLERQALLQARAETRIAEGTKDLVKGMKDWRGTLQKANDELEDTGKISTDTQKDMTKFNKELSSTMKNLLNMSKKDYEMLPEDFAAKNLDLLDQVAEGVPGAYEKLCDAARDAIVNNFDISDLTEETQAALDEGVSAESLLENAQNQMNELSSMIDGFESELEPIEVEAQLNSDEFLAKCNGMVQQAGLSADAVKAYFASMGYDVEITEDPEEINQLSTTKTNSYWVPAQYSQGTTLKEGKDGEFATVTQTSAGHWETVTDSQEEEYAKPGAFAIKSITPSGAGAGGGVSRKNSGGGGGGGGRGCFIAGTLITTGNTYKNIEDIQIGDIVLSYNEKIKKNEYSVVLQTMIHHIYDNIYTLYIEDEKLIVTGIHRFLIIDNDYTRWIAAENLQIGDKVLFADGTVHSIRKIDVELKVETVYNFEVSNNHNYYVGKNKILAHNKGGGKKGGGGSRARTTTKRVTTSHEDNRERYRPVVQQLEKLNNAYTDVGKAQDLAFGKKHLKNLQESIELQDKIIKQQAEYRRQIAANVKQDTENIKKQQLKNNTSIYGNASYSDSKLKFKKGGNLKITEKTNFAVADISTATYGKNAMKADDIDIKNGVITNYNDIVHAADESFNNWVNTKYVKYDENLKYNGKNKKKVKANNALKNEYEKRKAIHDQFLANLAQLEETLKLQAEQITAAIENEITQIQNRIDTALYTVNIKLEIDNSELERLDFLMGTLRDDARDAAAYIAKSAEKMAIWEQQAADNLEGMSKVIGTIANNDNLKFIEDNNGKKQWFNKEGLENDEIDDSKQFLNGADIIEKLQSSDTTVSQKAIDTLKLSKALTTKQLDELSEKANDQLTYVQNIHSEWINMYSRMSSAISEYSQEMDTVIAKQEHNNTLMESYRNAVELIGRSNFYKSDASGTSRSKGRDLEAQMDEQTQKARLAQIGTYQEQLKNVQADIELFKGRRDDIAKKGLDNAEVKRSYDEYNKIIAEREEKEREINENIAASFEEALQSNLDAWQKAMQRITEEFEESLAGDAITLDYLADALERYTKINSTLVPEYEKVHQLRMLDLEAEKSINEANDPKIKQELLEIQDEITQATAKGTKMSQYELDYLRQKLELKQAEAALDDASKAKTQVSLTRDNEGNFGYVYTADDSGVADAEKNYADKIYEMQKANAEYITELQGTIVETEQDYRSRMQEIANDTTLSEETRKAKMDQLRADFDQLHRDLTGQLTLALEASRDVYGQYSEQYAAITGDLTALNVKHVENWEDTQLSLQTGIKSIDDYEDKWSKNSDSYREKMEGSMDQYKDKWEETMEAYKGKAKEGQSVTEEFAKTATTEMSNLATKIASATTEMTTLGTKTSEALGKIAEEAKKLEDKFVGNIGNMITKASNLVENLNKVKKALIDLDPDEEETPPPGTDPPLTQQKNNKTLKMGRRKQAQYFTRGLKISKRNLKSSRALRKYLRKKGITGDRAKKNAFFAAVARATGRRVKSVRAAQKALKKKLVNPYSSIKVYFDTGGYTGDWAGNEGRMAMLHKKEMVLNQRDTSNILSAVDMIRGISEKIDLNALAQSGALSSGLSSGINGVSNGLLEQNVHITAEFPNATDHNEITEAFNNIIGLAAQYANR